MPNKKTQVASCIKETETHGYVVYERFTLQETEKV